MRLVGPSGEVSQKRQKLPFAYDFHDIFSHDIAKHLVGVYAPQVFHDASGNRKGRISK